MVCLYSFKDTDFLFEKVKVFLLCTKLTNVRFFKFPGNHFHDCVLLDFCYLKMYTASRKRKGYAGRWSRLKTGPHRGAYVRRYGGVKRRRILSNVRTGGFIGMENKFVDIETDSDAFATTWSTMEDGTNSNISGVAQGIGESQRIGRKYTITSIHIRCLVHTAASEAQPNPQSAFRGRICLVLDTQTNGAQLTATDVMDGGLTNDFLAFRNLQFTKRFKVLWDKSFVLTPIGQVNDGAVDKFSNGSYTTNIMSYNKNFTRGLNVLCDGTSAAVASITDNSLHIIGVGNSAGLLLDMQVRIRYKG